MKFRDYLNEETENVDKIKRDCKPFLKLSKGYPYTLWRGTRHQEDFLKLKVRTNRKPRFIPFNIHKIMDKDLNKIFGWKVRSEGLFTGDINLADSYGTPMMVFPIGKFKYIWTKDYKEIYKYYDYFAFADKNGEVMYDSKGIFKDEYKDKYEDMMKDIKKRYKSTGWPGEADEFEMIIKVKEYYIGNKYANIIGHI